MPNYKYYDYKDAEGRVVIAAASRYAGRTVKGYAKCDPEDEFDYEFGKALAKARCDSKIATKRRKNATRRLDEAREKYIEAQNYLIDMMNYYNDSLFKERDLIEEERVLAESK